MNTETKPTPARKKKRSYRLLLVLVGLLLVIWLLPLFLSGPLKSWVLGAVAIPGELSAERISLGWTRGPVVEGLALADPEGEPVLSVERLEMPDTSLVSLLFGSRDLGQIHVVKLLANLVQDAEGRTNLDRALGHTETAQKDTGSTPDRPGQTGKAPADLAVAIVLEEPRLTYQTPDLAPITAQASRFEASLSVAEGAVLVIESTISQGADSGTLSVDLRVDGIFDGRGALTPTNTRMTGKATATNLPVEAVDRIASLNGKLLAALGPRLNLDFQTRLESRGTKAVGPVALKVNAARVKGGFEGRITPEGLVSEGENRFDIVVTPELLAMPPAQPGEALPLPELTAPTKLSVSLRDLSLPQGDMAQARFVLDVHGDNLETRTRNPDYQLIWRDLAMRISKSADTPDVLMNLEADLTSRARGDAQTTRGALKVDNRITGLFAAGQTVTEVHTELKGKNLPVGFVDGFMQLEGLVTDLVGEEMDLDMTGTFDQNAVGVFQVEAASPLAKVQFPARLDKDLTLQRQSNSAFAVTPKLSERLVEKILPVIGIRASAKPVEVSLLADRFHVPVENFIFEDIGLGARLSLGEVELDDQAPLFMLLRSFPEVNLPKAYKASFDTFDVNLAQGVVSFQRIHLKTGNLAFNFGGSVNLSQNQIAIEMQLPGTTLTALFPKLEGLVDPGDAFKIPVHGGVEAPKFDKARFLDELKPLLIKAGIRGLLGGDEDKKPGLGDLLDILGNKKKDTNKDKENKDGN